MYSILVCDDERDIVSALKIYLEAEGYGVLEAFSGLEALELLGKNEIHLVLMDIMMPEMDGISAMAEIRRKSNVPVILLTAKAEDSDKVLGLNVGADDYVTKPFNPVELLARVRSQLRRYMQLGGGAQKESSISIGTLLLDDKSKEVSLDGELKNLTPTEYDILKFLMEHPGQVFSPRDIYRAVWKDEPYGAESTVAVHIRHLREKIEINPAEPRYIKAVWGQGYKMARVFQDMPELAQVEKTMQLLAEEIEKTRRRVNALEYVMIPDLSMNIKYITMKLEENENSTKVRLLKVKEMVLQDAHNYK